MRKQRAIYLAVILIVSAFFLTALPVQDQNLAESYSACSDCNVILISIDTLRADHLGTYGYEKNTSPNIDRFAEDSIVFENAIAQSTWTLPSHASLFTSQYVSTHGVNTTNAQLPSSKDTLTEALGQKGYKTGGFHGGTFLAARHGFAQGFDVYQNTMENMSRYMNFNNSIPAASSWLKQKDSKFFLFLHGFDVHYPYLPPPPYQHMFDPDYEGEIDNLLFNLDRREQNNLPYIHKDGDGWAFRSPDKTLSLSENDIRHIRAHYDGGIRYTDALLGEFFRELKKQGLYNESIIIIVSDHGENLGNHRTPNGLYFGHLHPYEHTVRVPLIIHLPGISSQRISEQVELIDIMPTITSLLNIHNTALQKRMEGENLLSLLHTQYSGEFKPYAFSETSDVSPKAKSVRTPTFKLIKRYNGRENVLYNLKNDAEETQDIKNTHYSAYSHLNDVLSEFVATRNRSTTKKKNLSSQITKQLENLGYLQ